MRTVLKILLFLFFLALFQGCMDDDLLHDFDRLNENRKGKAVFVVNEGNFMYGNSSLTYYNPETKEVLNDVFYKTNALPLGDVAYSMAVRDSLGYIVVNNSGKIYIINIHTFKYAGKITGFTSPRYIHFINRTKAYVSDLYAKTIYVVDLEADSITGRISIDNHNSGFYQHPSEQMLSYGNRVFVNCWSYDNKVLVIDASSDKVVDSITTGKQPNSMVMDKNRKLWVLCDGGSEGSPYGQENASLLKINAETLLIENRYDFPDINASPSNLSINGSGDTLFYLYNTWSGGALNGAGVYKMAVSDNSPGATPLIVQGERLFYAVRTDPASHLLYVSDAIDFMRPGKVYVYSTSGVSVDTITAGIIPGYFCFTGE